MVKWGHPREDRPLRLTAGVAALRRNWDRIGCLAAAGFEVTVLFALAETVQRALL